MNLGKLTLQELRGFLALADQVDAVFFERRQAVESTIEKKAAVEPHLFGWGEYYKLPPLNLAARVIDTFGLGEAFVRAWRSKQPQSALLDLATMEVPDEWVADQGKRDAILRCVALVMCLRQSFRSVGYYGKWMYELLEAGDDESLLMAIAIDPVASGNQVMQERLAWAVFAQDREFLERYAKAFSGPSRKISKQHNRIRVAAKLLKDAGAFPMSSKDLVHLFCEELKLYKGGEDPAKALRKVIHIVTPTPTT